MKLVHSNQIIPGIKIISYLIFIYLFYDLFIKFPGLNYSSVLTFNGISIEYMFLNSNMCLFKEVCFKLDFDVERGQMPTQTCAKG